VSRYGIPSEASTEKSCLRPFGASKVHGDPEDPKVSRLVYYVGFTFVIGVIPLFAADSKTWRIVAGISTVWGLIGIAWWLRDNRRYRATLRTK